MKRDSPCGEDAGASGAPPAKLPRGDGPVLDQPCVKDGEVEASLPVPGREALEAAGPGKPNRSPERGEAGGAEEPRDDVAAEVAAAEAEAAIARVWKNRVACLSALCQHAQRIERVWDEDEALRRALLGALSSCLGSLSAHKDGVMRELSSLAPKISPDATLRHFLTIALPIERQHTRGLRDHEFLVLRPDDLGKKAALTAPSVDPSATTCADRPRMALTVVLDNLRSAFNVGSIFRTAECLRVERLHLCGYTATPSEGGGGGQTGRAAMGADANVPWDHRPKSGDVVCELRKQGVPVFALETVEGAASVHDFIFPSPCALLLGNERHGVEADLLAQCSAPVRIPCHGFKNSLNVSVAFAICAYEVARQWRWAGGASADPPAAGAAASAVPQATYSIDPPGGDQGDLG